MIDQFEDGRGGDPRAPVSVFRAREGRLLAGVCAGLPEFWGLGTNGLRVVFGLLALCGGIGIVVYLACWLVIPTAEEEGGEEPVRDVVVLAWAIGAVVAFVLIAALSAAATVFGLGWLVFGIATAILLVTLSGRARVPSLATLLTVAALALPAVAVALSPVRIALQSGSSVSRPTTAAELSDTTFRSGFGTLLIDLRHTQIPSSGTWPLHIQAGLRRTIVALPADQCVRVRVHYDIHTFVSQFTTLLSGHRVAPFSDVVLFGRLSGGEALTHPHGTATSGADSQGATLDIDFSSLGGSLYVRDYPDDVDPDAQPNWPGFEVTPEPKPNLRGEPRKVARMIVRAYHRRLRVERADRRQIDALMPGPCVR